MAAGEDDTPSVCGQDADGAVQVHGYDWGLALDTRSLLRGRQAAPPWMRAELVRLRKENAELANNIRNLMFTFEDLVGVPETALRDLLGAVDKKILALALKGASETVKVAAVVPLLPSMTPASVITSAGVGSSLLMVPEAWATPSARGG